MDEVLEDRLREMDNAAGVSDSLSNLNDDEENSEGSRSLEEHQGEQHSQEKLEGKGNDNGEPSSQEMDQDPEWIDVLGSGTLWKKVIKPGTQSPPERGQRVVVCYTGTYDGQEFEKKDDFAFTLGESECIQALDIVVSLMEVGEVSLIKSSSRFAFGADGFPPIVPGDAEVEFEVELISVESVPTPSEMPIDEKLVFVDAKRERGNTCFRELDFVTAEKHYKKALDYCEVDFDSLEDPEKDEKQKELLELKIKCLNNLVATYQKLDNDSEALAHCNMVLALDKRNIKALFKQGKLLMGRNDFEGAIQSFTAAAKVEPTNMQFREELQKAKQALASYHKKMRSVYGSMVKGMSSGEEGASPAMTPPQTPQKKELSLDDSRAEIDVEGFTPAKSPQKPAVSTPAKPPPLEEISNPSVSLQSSSTTSAESAESSASDSDMTLDPDSTGVEGKSGGNTLPKRKKKASWWPTLSPVTIITLVVGFVGLFAARNFLQ